MKKLLKVSLAAVLAVVPVAAFAEKPVDSGTAPFDAKSITSNDTAMVASTKYVKGAYNDAIGKINKVAERAGQGQTATDVQTAINNAAYNGISTDNSGHLSVDLTSKGGLQFDGSSDGSKTLSVNIDSSTLAIDSTSGKIGVKANTFDAYGAATGVQSSIEGKLDDGANGYEINAKSLQVQGVDVLTTNSALNGAKLQSGTVAEAALTEALQTKINSALTSHQDITGKANVDMDNLSTTGKANVSAKGTVDLTKTDYADNTIGKALVSIKTTADNALTSNSALNGAKLQSGTVAKTALESGVQSSLDLADNAANKNLTNLSGDGKANIAVVGTYSPNANYDTGTIGKAIKDAQSTASTANSKVVPVAMDWTDEGVKGEVALTDPTIAQSNNTQSGGGQG